MTTLPPDVDADLREENARLTGALRAAWDRQAAGAEILRSIAEAPGDARRSLQRIAEITERLFGASSVTLLIADGERWGLTIRVGAGSERIATALPIAHVAIAPQFMPGAVYLENRQVHVADIDDPAAVKRWPGLTPARAAGSRTMSGTPLRREGRAIGALIVHRDRAEPFKEDELALLQSFADQAVIAIENTRLFNETREALERQTATADILKVIASSPADVQPVFEAIAKSSNNLIGGFSTAVLRFVGDELHLAAFTPTNPTADETLKSSFPRPLSEFPLFVLVRDGETQQFTDTESEDVPPLLRDIARLRGYRSMLFTPLMSQGKPIGIISVTRKETGTFAAHHVQLVRTFADQAVIAIENVRLFDEVQAKTRDLTETLQQQTATADVLEVISRSAFDLKPVFETVAESSVKLCGSERALIFRFDGELLRVAAAFNAPHRLMEWLERNPIRPGRYSVAARAGLEHRTVHVRDVLADPEHTYGAKDVEPFRTVLGVPMLKGDDLLGVILVYHNEVRPFTEKQIALVETFADQAVIAIENVRLFDEVQAKTRDLTEALQQQTATADILRVIASSPSDVQPVFDAVAERAMSLLDCWSVLVTRFDGEHVHFGAARGALPDTEKFVRQHYPMRPNQETSLLGRSLLERTVVSSPDVQAEADPQLREYARKRGFHGELVVPLLRDDKVEGALVLTRAEPGPFAPREIALVQSFADQAVIAIQNVRMFTEVQARTRDLSEALDQQTATANVLKVISRSVFDLQTVLDTLVESAYKLCGANLGLLYLRGDEAFECKAIAGVGVAEASLLFKGRPIRAGRGTAAERVILTGEVQSITNFYEDPEMDPKIRETIRNASSSDSSIGQIRSTLAVPMTRDNAVIGVMVIGSSQTGPFPQRQIELLQTFADQAVIAIENVRLFDEVQARTRELSQSLDELRAAQDRLVQTEKLASLGQLTAGIAHEIKNPLNFVNNFSALSAELTNELNDVLKSAALAGNIRKEVDELTGLLRDNLVKVVQHGKRADSIVKNMLLHSREGSGEHRPADINALLEESLNLAYHGARAEKPQFNVTLQRDFDEAAGSIEIFPQEITRVFLNLISNGFYAVTKRKTENRNSGFEPTVRATTRNLGHAVEIRIRDNGTGIPPEVTEKMFNPFFTTKPAGEGTGLGLSMSYDIVVKQHGGRIDVETVPGDFTEFTVVLPRTSNLASKSENQG